MKYKNQDFSIREVTQQDYKGLSRVLTKADALHSKALPHIFVETKKPARSREFISDIIADESAALFVAEHNGRIIGLVHVCVRESPSISLMVPRRYAYVENIVVTEEFRHCGVGQALMKEAQRWAMQKNISQVELNVWDFNEEAITFFKELGYTMARHQMWKSIK